MKKSIILLAVFVTTTFANAQLTKILEVDGYYLPYIYGSYQCGISGDIYVSSSGMMYLNDTYKGNQYMDYSVQDLLGNCLLYNIYVDEVTNKVGVKKYDENFNLIEDKVVIQNLPHFDNYVVLNTSDPISSRVTITSKMFNDDDNYEVLVFYSLENNDVTANISYQERYGIQQKLILVNKNGDILHDFGYAYTFSVTNGLNLYKNKWYWGVLKYQYNVETSKVEYVTDIYRISKQSPEGLSQVSPARMPAYPNPAMSEINIPTPNEQGVRIYDMNGRLVDSRSGNGEMVNVNVSDYPSGSYIYQTQGNSGVFIKQ